MRVVRASLDDFITSAINEAKRNAQSWHKENSYYTKIRDSSTILDMRSCLEQGKAWEDGCRYGANMVRRELHAGRRK